MNMQMILWAVVAAVLISFCRELWIDFRIWWITSKAGYAEYRLKLYVIHYRIAMQLRLYIWRLYIGSLWQKVRVKWWMMKINLGYRADYPSYNPSPMYRKQNVKR